MEEDPSYSQPRASSPFHPKPPRILGGSKRLAPPPISSAVIVSPLKTKGAAAPARLWRAPGHGDLFTFETAESLGLLGTVRTQGGHGHRLSSCSLCLPGDAPTVFTHPCWIYWGDSGAAGVCHPLSPCQKCRTDPQRSPSPTPGPAQPQQSHPGIPGSVVQTLWSSGSGARSVLWMERSGRCSIGR